MNITVDLQNRTSHELPTLEDLERWVAIAIEDKTKVQSVCLSVVEPDEIQSLNKQFRHKDKPTNVLSFPNQAPIELSDGFMGDMVVCAQILEQEAHQQNKDLVAHWAHMVIHSTLHLQGYDHRTEDDAFIMESKEITLMKELGFGNPYQEVEHV